jgi:ubiquinone biosynthesis protein UbiJ
MDEKARLIRGASPIHMAETALNGLLRLDPEFLEALEPLQDRIVAVELAGLEQTLFLKLGVEGVSLLNRDEVEAIGEDRLADVTFEGSPPALLGMVAAMRRGDAAFRDDVRISGDLSLLEAMKTAFQRLDIDLEELLSRFVGDIAAHEIGRGARAFWAWGQKTSKALAADIGEYLVEELRVSPSPLELEDFAADVDRLRDDVERLEKRVARLRARSPEPLP